MITEILDLTGKIAPGVIAALVASWVTVRLALGRFKKEALWQRKLDAYTRILDALHVCRLRSEQLERELSEGSKLSSEQQKDMDQKYSSARSELQRVIDSGSLILPSKATALFAEVMRPRYIDWQEMPPHEFWESEEYQMKKALESLTTVGRADLKG